MPHTLDPADWDAVRALGHRMVDDMTTWLSAIREQPAWRAMPDTARAALRESLPEDPQGLERAYQDFQSSVLPYAVGNTHPRFWGWVKGTGSAEGMLAGLLTDGLNLNAWGGEDAAPYVELQVLDWLKQLVGFPASASGLLVTGGSMANIIALAVARDRHLDPDRGLQGAAAPLRVYCSDQTHNWVDKAGRLLGLGREGIRSVPTTTAFEMDLAALDRMIGEDRAAGCRPVCVIGNAGTVNTGATDDLAALAAVCRREGLWFHVDGAFGALVAMSERLRPLVQGMEQADSVAFDLHKWLHVPYDCGCVLVRDAEAHRRSFSPPAGYLAPLERGTSAGPINFGEYGPDLSRSFRALKVWLCFKAHGTSTYARMIEQNVEQARALAARIEAEPELELLAPVPLNVVCFRYRPAGTADGKALDGLNREILMHVQEEGLAVPSGTMVRGQFAIRCAITNHRSRPEDFEMLCDGVLRIGRARG
jgi:aromatic-L-amino-acid decarboxylase